MRLNRKNKSHFMLWKNVRKPLKNKDKTDFLILIIIDTFGKINVVIESSD